MPCLYVLFTLLSSVAAQCLNERGEARNWFVIFKMPDGYTYFYADDVNGELTKGALSLKDIKNPVARVLAPVYASNFTASTNNFILYNDQVPDGPTSNRGHTKGAVVWNDDGTAQWIIHSVPHFPPQQEKGYSYPETARRYGQSILCIALDQTYLSEIATHLWYTWPRIYNSSVSPTYTERIPTLKLVLDGKHVKKQPWLKVQHFETVEGATKFTAFAKTAQFGSDLYKDVIAHYYNTDVYTETWQNGAGRLSSNCTGDNSVYNIAQMKLQNTVYKETQDHSKWALTKDVDQGVLCIGGINRMESQFSRGGGTLCFEAGAVWKQLDNGIQEWEECGVV